MQTQVQSGEIIAISLTFCFLQSEGQTFFLHQSDILHGKHLVNVGTPVRFMPAPPLGNGKFPRATRAIVGGSNDRN